MLQYFRKFIKRIHERGILNGLSAAKRFIMRELFPLFPKVPRSVLLFMYPFYSLLSSKMRLGVIRPKGEVYKVIPFGRSSFYIPDLSADLFHLSDFKSGNPPESVDHNLTKYCTCLNCDCLDDGDKVIDVGGFIGAVSIGIAEQGAEVIAVEPSERNAECIRRNAAEFDVTDLVTVVQNPVYSSQTEMKLNLSMDPTDNSLINPDTPQIRTRKVETTTIDSLATEHNFPRIDLLKMDAEGVEPEVLEGAKQTSIRQVAIDCSAERKGKNTFDRVNEELIQRGYKTISSDSKDGWDVIYGRCSDKYEE